MKTATDLRSRLFAGVFPAGIGYCDTSKEEDGDFLSVAFLPFASLELDVRRPRSPLLPLIREDAAKIIARRGEQYQVSTCGQTVLLGGPLPTSLAPEFRTWLREVAAGAGKTPEKVYAMWREYAESCRTADQSPVCSEFLEWYRDKLAGPVRLNPDPTRDPAARYGQYTVNPLYEQFPEPDRRPGRMHQQGTCGYMGSLCAFCYDQQLQWHRQVAEAIAAAYPPAPDEDYADYWRRVGGRMLDTWPEAAQHALQVGG